MTIKFCKHLNFKVQSFKNMVTAKVNDTTAHCYKNAFYFSSPPLLVTYMFSRQMLTHLVLCATKFEKMLLGAHGAC